jgi:hypothetical protein
MKPAIRDLLLSVLLGWAIVGLLELIVFFC